MVCFGMYSEQYFEGVIMAIKNNVMLDNEAKMPMMCKIDKPIENEYDECILDNYSNSNSNNDRTTAGRPKTTWDSPV